MQNENAGGGVDLYRHAVPGKWVDSGKKVLFFLLNISVIDYCALYQL